MRPREGSSAATTRNTGRMWTTSASAPQPILLTGPGDGGTTGPFERYCEALNRGMRPVEGEEVLSPEQRELERLYLGLRTRRGLSLPSLRKESLPVVRELKRAGLVTIRGDRLCPSRRGYLVADSLPVLLSP